MLMSEIIYQLKALETVLFEDFVRTGEILDVSSEDLSRLKDVTLRLVEISNM